MLFCVIAYFYLLTLPISKECLKFGVTLSSSETAQSPSVSENTPILNSNANIYNESPSGKSNAVHNAYIAAIELGNISGRKEDATKRSRAPSMDLGRWQ